MFEQTTLPIPAMPPAAESFTLTSREYVENPTGEAAIVNVLTHWHNDTHPGSFSVCDQQPCHAVRMVASAAVNSAHPTVVAL